jgi:ATP-dependent Lon protease
MNLPREVPVMTLPNVTLFPQALLPLYIFESRYRRMLADVLDSHRLFCVAMRKPGSQREKPLPVAGVGVIRVSVEHKDSTSHLILQGIARVVLEDTVRTRPYRVVCIRPLTPPPCDNVATDALLAKVRELLQERFTLGLPFPFPISPQGQSTMSPQVSAKDVLGFLDSVDDPEQAVDLVSCAVLPDPLARQAMLEIVDVESRLRRLIQFLLGEIRTQRRDKHE